MRTFAKTLFAAFVVVATSAAGANVDSRDDEQWNTSVRTGDIVAVCAFGTDVRAGSWCYFAGFTGNNSASAAYSAASQRTHRAARAAECTVADSRTGGATCAPT